MDIKFKVYFGETFGDDSINEWVPMIDKYTGKQLTVIISDNDLTSEVIQKLKRAGIINKYEKTSHYGMEYYCNDVDLYIEKMTQRNHFALLLRQA